MLYQSPVSPVYSQLIRFMYHQLCCFCNLFLQRIYAELLAAVYGISLCIMCLGWILELYASQLSQLSWPPASPPAILFYGCSLDLLFSLPNLRGRLADRHQTLPMVSQIYKIRSEIWVSPSPPLPPPRNLAVQKHQNFGAILHNFATWSRISPERNKTSSIGKRRCKLRTLPHMQT